MLLLFAIFVGKGGGSHIEIVLGLWLRAFCVGGGTQP